MLYIFIATVFYSIAIMLITYASRLLGSNLTTAIANFMSAIVPVLIVIPMITKKTGSLSKEGLFAAFLSGIAITIFALSLNKSFQVAKVALVSPMVFGGMIFLTAILSYFFFKEKLSPLHITGLFVLGVGLAIIVYAAATGK